MPKKADKIIKTKDKNLDEVPSKFTRRVKKAQSGIYSKLLDELTRLDTEDGNLKVSKRNVNQIPVIVNKLRKILEKGEYSNVVRLFIKDFNTQEKLSNEYFKETFKDFSIPLVAKTIVDTNKKVAVDSLLGASLDKDFYKPIEKQLLGDINNGASYREMVKSLRTITLGDKTRLGRLHSYTKQISHDAFALTDRSYMSAVANSIGVEFYKYSSGTLPDSRPFCLSRINRFYHIKEIMAWGDLAKWQGQISGTNRGNITINLGGHNCMHSLIPQSVFRVPTNVIRRAMRKGFYKPSEAVREELGL